MKLKLLLAGLVIVAVVGGMAYAQNGEYGLPWQRSYTLTDEQKAELQEIFARMRELREELLDRLAEYGVISSERAEWMKERWRLWQEERRPFGRGFHHARMPRHRHHMMHGWGW